MAKPTVTPLSEGINIGDVLKWEVNPNFCRARMALKAATEQSIVIGSPLEDDTDLILVANGQEASVIAIALEAIEAEGEEEIMCLVRGPALIDKDRLTLETSVTAAELEPYLAVLGIRYLTEPAQYEEGLPTS